MKRLLKVLTAALMLATVPAIGAEPDDSYALRGVKIGKAFFDVNVGEAPKLALYLQVIKETHQGLVRQNVKPEIIIAFRGPSVQLVTLDSAGIPVEHQGYLTEVRRLISELKALGVRFEACAVATRLFDIDNSSVLSDVTVVGNTFISSIGYQTRGYAIIPIL